MDLPRGRGGKWGEKEAPAEAGAYLNPCASRGYSRLSGLLPAGAGVLPGGPQHMAAKPRITNRTIFILRRIASENIFTPPRALASDTPILTRLAESA